MSNSPKPKVKAAIPVFDGTERNFHVWKVQFTSYLSLMRLSHYLTLPENKPEDHTDSQKWEQDNADFYGILQLALNAKTCKEVINLQGQNPDGSISLNGALAWRQLNNLLRSKSILRLCDLETELNNMKMATGEHPTHFISRLKEVINEIEQIENEKTPDIKMVTYIIKRLPSEYKTFVISQAANPTQNVNELTTQLVNIHNVLKSTNPETINQTQQTSPSTEQALLTLLKQFSSPEDILKQISQLQTSEQAHYSNTQIRGNTFRGRNRGRSQRPIGPCHYCGVPGHKKFDCEKRKNDIQSLDKKQYIEHVVSKNSNTNIPSNYKYVSQTQVNDDWQLNPIIANKCFKLLNTQPTFDLCATSESTKAPS
jgi:hypothetical protein